MIPTVPVQQTHPQIVFLLNLCNPTSLAVMSLESGKYTITSKLGDAPVGRRLAEPADTRPKGIFKLPQDTAVHPTIVSSSDVYRILENRSLITTVIRSCGSGRWRSSRTGTTNSRPTTISSGSSTNMSSRLSSRTRFRALHRSNGPSHATSGTTRGRPTCTSCDIELPCPELIRVS